MIDQIFHILPQYDFKNYLSNVRSNQMDNYLRPARITSVDATKGVCEIQWLDHPGTRRNVVISLAAQGVYDMPTPGTLVLIAFDKGYNALIVRTLSQNLPSLNGTAENTVAQMRKLNPGDKLFTSFRNTDDVNQLTPLTSGSELWLKNTGDIVISDINGQFWHMDPQNILIEQSSINSRISTEAGVVDFGLVKRDFAVGIMPGQTESRILNTAGLPISPGEKALTEFRVRVTETSDTDLTTPPEIDNPLVELTLGTKIKSTAAGSIKVYSLDLTDTSHAVPGQEIIIQLKTKADQGFEFTVDKSGNVTLKIKGDVKIDVGGKAAVSAAEVDVNATVVNVSATNVTAKAGSVKVDAQQVELAGTNGVVLDSFIAAFNSHTHPTAGTGSPSAPTSPITGHVSKVVTVK